MAGVKGNFLDNSAQSHPGAIPRERLSSRALGAMAEDTACAYLASQQYTILARNWRCRWGELDIVARHGRVLVAVEVKSSYRGAVALENITPRKLLRVQNLLRMWLKENRIDEFAAQSRIDAIGICFLPRLKVEHLVGLT